MLIAGKELPAGRDLASGASLKGRTTLVTADQAYLQNMNAVDAIADNASIPVPWNRTSSLSTRSLILSCVNAAGRIDDAVLVFDEFLFSTKYKNLAEIAPDLVCDDLILSYQYLTTELINRFINMHKVNGVTGVRNKLVFMYRANPSVADAVVSPGARTETPSLSPYLVAAAGAAFKAFAENVAASLVDNQIVLPILVAYDASNEVARRDASLSGWLCDYIDQIDAMKHDLTPKQKVTWVKAGARTPGGFSLFH